MTNVMRLTILYLGHGFHRQPCTTLLMMKFPLEGCIVTSGIQPSNHQIRLLCVVISPCVAGVVGVLLCACMAMRVAISD